MQAGRRISPFVLLALWHAGAAADITFTNVQIVPMDEERILRDQYLVIRDGRIAEFGPRRQHEARDGERLIDAGGRYVQSGLAEMHAHVPGADRREYAEEVLSLFAVNGVTLARGMLGQPWHLALREQLAKGEVFGPRLYTSGPSLNGNSVSDAADAERQVRTQAAAGYDFLKLHPGLSRESFDAIARTAHELGLPFAGHVSSDVGLERVLAAGQASIVMLRGRWLDRAELDRRLAAIAARHAAN